MVTATKHSHTTIATLQICATFVISRYWCLFPLKSCIFMTSEHIQNQDVHIEILKMELQIDSTDMG